MRVRAAVIAGVMACAAGGVAGAAPAVRLVVHGDACSAEVVRARVIALRGADPFADAAPIAWVLTFATQDGGASVAADIDSDRGARHLVAASCDALADELAIAIGVELEDLSRDVAPPPPAPAAPAAPDHVTASGVATRVEVASRDAAALQLEAATSFGVVAGHARTQAAIGAAWRRGARSLGVEARWVTPETLGVAADASASVTTATAATSACLHAGAAAACAVVAAGGVHGSSAGLMEARSAWSPLVALGARATWEHAVGAGLALQASAEVDAPVTTTQFLVDDMPVWKTSRVEAWLGIGVVSHFP
jgi:hypothetical protein